MIITLYFRQNVKNILKNNQSKQKFSFIIIFEKFSLIFNFYLRPVNTRVSNNVNEHKADRKNGKRALKCGLHMYPKSFMKCLQILHGQLSGVHCLFLCLKIFRISEFFISFGKFRHRTAPII